MSTQTITQKRGQIKAQLTRFRTFLNSPIEQQNKSIEYIQTRLDNALQLWDKFEKVQSEIEELDNTEEQERERLAFENSYFDTIALGKQTVARAKMTSFGNNSINNDTHNRDINEQTTVSHVKLPTIELPSFNGAYDEWLEFHDLFQSLIHNNQSLSLAQRFHYLKSALKDEAAEVISSLTISDANYEIAWQLLKDRYGNQKIIISKHVTALFELPVIQKESHAALRQLIDHTLKHLRALKTLNQPTEHWDTLIIHLVLSKLDYSSKREWESSIKNETIPTLELLMDLLRNRAQMLESIQSTKSNNVTFKSPSNNKNIFNKQPPITPKSQSYTKAHVVTNQPNCVYCKGNHGIYRCTDFLKLSTKDRLIQTKNLKVCINCFRQGHYAPDCNAGSCRVCKKKHNTLLHIEEVTTIDTNSNHNNVSTTTHCTQLSNQILLSTAMVLITDRDGKSHEFRALLDSGSQSNFITEQTCKRLNLQCTKINLPVIGINQVQTNISSQTEVTIKSKFNSFKEKIRCLVLPQITGHLPNVKISSSQVTIPEGIQLADSEFHIPRKIDILIGAELFWNLLCVGQFKEARNQPTLQKTKLGWIISGPVQCPELSINQSKTISNLSLEHQLERFWTLESMNNSNIQSPDDIKCEEYFKATTIINEDGRYTVSLPMREDLTKLGESRENAIQRLHAMERRFKKNPDLKLEYIKFMQEYKEMGHMVEISENDEQVTPHYYMPHHAVLKDTSETTKLRVVFDASCKSTSGISLNEIMHVGPTIQDDLLSIILRFRNHNYVVTADIAKMYRQIHVKQEQQELQRIVWRETSNELIKSYKLTTVTYGTAAAPFLAVRCLKEVAKENQEIYPQASHVINEDFYVDDLISGAKTIKDAKGLVADLNHILKKRGFELRKWTSNSHDILEEISHDHENLPHAFLNKNQEQRTLGLWWDSNQDKLQYRIQTQLHDRKPTKRSILSTISKIFDPLGLIGPTTIKAKIILQQLWQLQLTWDESIPIHLHTMWIQFHETLHNLNNLNVPRHIICNQPVEIQLHGFSDASIAAYGACLYVRSVDADGGVQVHLATAKSRVAPLKCVSLPRLELCAALLLSQLAKKYKEATKLTFIRNIYWCDSTITLAWIAGAPNKWKTFVSNRVNEIQIATGDGEWRHVASSDNPADIISRGVTADQLIHNQLWWNGPQWLQSNHWPPSYNPKETDEELKPTVSCITTNQNETSFLCNYSNFNKLQRIIAYCLRFRNNCSQQKKGKTGMLTSSELEEATLKIIFIIQHQCFSTEITALQCNDAVNKGSTLLRLNPYLDDHGLIRVGGRIRYANVSIDQKHPLILPKEHHVTYLIIKQKHSQLHHCGHEQLLAAIRLKFWPLSGRQIVKRVIRTCIRCFKFNPKGIQPMMGDLPKTRITASCRPFTVAGVDYAGPIQVRTMRSRGKPLITKGYICIFVCFSTKAIHIELVSNLTTDCFLAALRRFTARRGLCHILNSDNGTNFTGANARLKELYEFLSKNEDHIKLNLAQRNIQWNFIPPRAPHFGGLWEAAVKTVKSHLFRTIQTSILTFEEYNTLLIEIEGILNSRPIIPMSTSPNDLTPLTPSHFLIGDSLIDPIEEDLSNIPENRLDHWQRIQQIKQHFWKRWHREYLHQLQVRGKWHSKSPNVEVGTLVLLIEDNLPPLRWITGRIVSIHPGKDNIVRVVTVKTASGTYKRPVSKLCPLPIDT